MGWLNTLVDEAKFAHDINYLGPAYYITSQSKEDLREQGKEDEAREIEKAEAIGTVGGAIAGLTLGKGVPLITKGISAFRTAFPKVATGIDFVLTADGIRNLATENGIQKTVNYAKDGNWGRAAASGTMDALDLLGGVGLVGDAYKGFKKIKNYFGFWDEIPHRAENWYRGVDAQAILDAETSGVIRGKENFPFGHPEKMYREGPFFGRGREPYHSGYVIEGTPESANWVQAHAYNQGYYKPQPDLAPNRDVSYSGEFNEDLYEGFPVTDWDAALTPAQNFTYWKKYPILGWKHKTFKHPNYKTADIKQYGNYIRHTNNFNLGYTTSGIKQTGTPTGNFHWREDITDINNPVLLDIKPDMHYTRTHTTPVIKEITNGDDMLQRIGIVPIYNKPIQAVEQITINPANKLVKVGERIDLNLSPNRVVQFEYQPRLVDNKGRLISSNANRYFGIPTKTETQYILGHKSGGTIHIKKKNKGKFTASAKAAGEGVQEHAHKVMNDPNATPLQKKRANFAIQAKKWHRKHQLGGKINYLDIFA